MRRLPSKPAHILEAEIRQQNKKRRKRETIAILIVLGIVILFLSLNAILNSQFVDDLKLKFSDIDCELRILDFKYGDCVLAECEGETVIIDTGKQEHREELISFLNSEKIDKIDCFFVTDACEEYTGVFESVISTVDVRKAIISDIDGQDESIYEKFDEISFLNGTLADKAVRGLSYIANDLSFQIAETESLSLYANFGKLSFLFWNSDDAEKLIEYLKSRPYIELDVLVINHDMVLSDEIYDYISPEICFLVTGKNSQEENSHTDDIIGRVYRTEKHGEIVITSDGVGLNIECENL